MRSNGEQRFAFQGFGLLRPIQYVTVDMALDRLTHDGAQRCRRDRIEFHALARKPLTSAIGLIRGSSGKLPLFDLSRSHRQEIDRDRIPRWQESPDDALHMGGNAVPTWIVIDHQIEPGRFPPVA